MSSVVPRRSPVTAFLAALAPACATLILAGCPYRTALPDSTRPGDARTDEGGTADGLAQSDGLGDASPADGDGLGGADDLAGADPQTTGLVLTVEPAFPSAPAWNDYLELDAATVEQATGRPCVSGVVCFHAGAVKRVFVANAPSCTGLALADTRDVFVWECRTATGGVAFFSTALMAGRGLADLITAAGWRQNNVTLTGPFSGASAGALWYSNPVVPLPDNAGGDLLVLDSVDDDGAGPDAAFAPGTIFTVSGDRSTAGYNLNADGLALVALVPMSFTIDPTALGNCWPPNGEAFGGTEVCVIAAGGQTGLWLEGFDVDCGGTAPWGLDLAYVRGGEVKSLTVSNCAADGVVLETSAGVSLSDVAASANDGSGIVIRGGVGGHQLRDVSVLGNTVHGLFLASVEDNLLEGVTGTSNGNTGIYLDNSSGNRLHGCQGANNASVGISLNNYSDRNLISDTRITNNQYEGFQLYNSTGNAIISLFSVGNSAANVCTTGTENVFAGVLSAASAAGFDLYDGFARNTFHQVAVLGNDVGFATGGTYDNTFSQMAFLGNTQPVNLQQTNGDKFTGALLVEGAAIVSSGTAPGLTDGTWTTTGLDGSSTYAYGSRSDAVLRNVAGIGTALIGQVMIDDPVNASDSAGGYAGYPGASGAFDWVHFIHPFRAWMRTDGLAGAWTAESGRIYDWRSKSSDTVLRTRAGGTAGSGPALVSGAPCPAIVHGNAVATDQLGRVFLLAAIEILRDGIGNHNGLCESGETCLYAPNIGLYQGDGATTTCVFQDDGGTARVTGVSIVGYVTNGG